MFKKVTPKENADRILTQLNALEQQVGKFGKRAVQQVNAKIGHIVKNEIPENRLADIQNQKNKIEALAKTVEDAARAKGEAAKAPQESKIRAVTSVISHQAVKVKDIVINHKLPTFVIAAIASVKATSSYLCQPEVIKNFLGKETEVPLSATCSAINTVAGFLSLETVNNVLQSTGNYFAPALIAGATLLTVYGVNKFFAKSEDNSEVKAS